MHCFRARLIGVEYIITEKLFRTLDDEEKKLWHSHKYEIESGKYVYVQLNELSILITVQVSLL